MWRCCCCCSACRRQARLWRGPEGRVVAAEWNTREGLGHLGVRSSGLAAQRRVRRRAHAYISPSGCESAWFVVHVAQRSRAPTISLSHSLARSRSRSLPRDKPAERYACAPLERVGQINCQRGWGLAQAEVGKFRSAVAHEPINIEAVPSGYYLSRAIH